MNMILPRFYLQSDDVPVEDEEFLMDYVRWWLKCDADGAFDKWIGKQLPKIDPETGRMNAAMLHAESKDVYLACLAKYKERRKKQ